MEIDKNDQDIIYYQLELPFGQNQIVFINNGLIQNIQKQAQTDFVTIAYSAGGAPNGGMQQELVLLVDQNTNIQNRNGRSVFRNQLRPGMRIDALVSAKMTRSLPPQTNAYIILINSNPKIQTQIAEGTVGTVNFQKGYFNLWIRGNKRRFIGEGAGPAIEGNNQPPMGPGPVIGGNTKPPMGPGPVIGESPKSSVGQGPGPVIGGNTQPSMGPGPVIGGNTKPPMGPGPVIDANNRIQIFVDQNTRFLNRSGRNVSFWNLKERDSARVKYQSLRQPGGEPINIALEVQIL